MKENIETKDVQRTEYLDKNGLDMLWAKVKENTNNQVEVERNRATTQESIIIDTKADKSELHSSYVSNSTFTALQEKVTANTAAISDKQDAGNYLSYDTLNNDGYYEIPSVCVINKDNRTATSMSSDEIKVNDKSFGCTIITTDGVSNKYATDFDFALGFNLNRNGIKLQGGDNNHVLTSNGSTIDITEYAKKTDIPEIDTSDFVSKSDTITQTINSGLIAMDKLQVFSKGYYDQTASLRGGIFIEGADTKFSLNDTTASHNQMVLTASKLTMSQDVGDNTLLITTSGIANTDNNADHVYATDGSIADLTQYAKKSEIAAGGNVDDVQVNGVSVVENKIANIKPATKESLGVVKVGDGLDVTDGTISVDSTAIGAGNYIPYNKTYESYYTIDGGLVISGEDCNSFYDKGSINFTYHNDSQLFNLSSNQIYGRVGNNSYTINAEDGIELRNGTYRIAISGTNGLRVYTTNDDGRIAKTTQISEGAIEFTDAQNGDYIFRINEAGIHYNGRKENEIPTANGGFVNINNYALKTELPTVPTKVSQLQNDSEFIAKSVYDEKIAALEARIAALEAKHAETA